MLTPAFHFRVLEQFLDIFIEEGNKLVENLKLSTNENIHDIVPLFTKHTLNAICGEKNIFNPFFKILFIF